MELQALDNQLLIIRKAISIQENALNSVEIQKQGARASELAVQKFKAEVYKFKSEEFKILQMINAAENHMNFLLGRYAQPVERNSLKFYGFTGSGIGFRRSSTIT